MSGAPPPRAAEPGTPGVGPRTPRAWLRSRLRSLRRWQLALLALALVLFLAISGLLARFLSVENTERDAVLAVLKAQAAGDAQGMLRLLHGCRERPGCAAMVSANAARLRRRGQIKILQLTSATAYTLTGATGATRVAWTVIGRLPVVQCVRVRRRGSFLAGVSVQLLSIGAPIPNEADC